MATFKITVSQHDDGVVGFHDNCNVGFTPEQVKRLAGLRSDVPFADVPAEVARLRAAGHEVTIARGTARRMAAAGVEVV